MQTRRASGPLGEGAEWARKVDPDLVIAEGRGDNAVRDSDRRYRNQYVMFVRFRDGRVAHWTEYSNPMVYRDATGD